MHPDLRRLLEVTEDLDYSIDTSATTSLANMANRCNFNPGSCLLSEYHTCLTTEAKNVWQKLHSDMKAVILKGRNSRNRSNDRYNSNESNNFSHESVKPSSFNGKPSTKTNLHKLLNESLVESNDSENNDDVAEEVDVSNDSTLLFNTTNASNINSGDIRKLISPPTKGKSIP